MIPFVNLQPALDEIRDDIDAAMSRVVDRGIFLNGPEVDGFELEWAAYCGQRFCVACANGTDGLTLAGMCNSTELKDHGLPSNTLSFSMIGLVNRNPLIAGSAREILAFDVDDRGWPVTWNKVVPVLLYGRFPPVDTSECLVVDACQAHGWKPAGHVIAHSFYPTKNLGCFGDGGAITTDDHRSVTRIREWTSGEPLQFHSRMSEINAAILRIKLPHLDRWNAARRRLSEIYYENLPDWCEPVCRPGEATNHHIFAILADQRDELERHLLKNEVGVKVHYRKPLAPLPGAVRWCSRVLSLPIWPGLKDSEVRQVCDTIRCFA